MSTPTIPAGNLYMNATTYTGSGGTTNITGFSFQPDLIWTKNRSNPVSHCWVDSNRGAPNQLGSDLGDAENSGGNDRTVYGGISTILSNGYTAVSGSDPTYKATNGSGQTYVSWYWKANQGTNVSNTSGSITSTVSVNATAGFSVVTWAGSGAAGTVGHGLGVTPAMIITKNRTTGSTSWVTWHQSLPSATATDAGYIYLNSTGAASTTSVFYNGTQISSSVFGLRGNNSNVNASSNNYVAYCWAPITGYSAFGSYVGNGSTDGPFIYLGFRPRFVMFKQTDTAGSNWRIFDSARDTYNAEGLALYPSLADAEGAYAAAMDFVSNGVKIRGGSSTSGYGGYNLSGGTYIYAAFAENPLKFANAR